MTNVKEIDKNTVIAKIEVTYWDNDTNKMEASNVCATFDANEWDENMFKVSRNIEKMIFRLFNEDTGCSDVDWEIIEEMHF